MKKKIRYIEEIYTDKYKSLYQAIQIDVDYDISRFEMAGEKLYYIQDSLPDVKGLRILRCGLYMGEVKKNRFEPSQSLAMSLQMKQFSNCVNLHCDDDRVKKYLKGETIEVEGKNGWTLVCVDGYPLGWGKLNNDILSSVNEFVFPDFEEFSSGLKPNTKLYLPFSVL